MRPFNGKYYKLVGRQKEHVLIAAAALGKTLPQGAHVHHVDGNPLNNRNENLVICPDNAYHQLLHRRERALDACGHADWRKCHLCKRYDAPENLVVTPRGAKGDRVYHNACNAKRSITLYHAKKEQ